MDIKLIANIYLFLCSGIAFVYALFRIGRSKKIAPFFQIAACTVLCILLYRTFYALTIIFFGDVLTTFNVGFIGYCAVFLFLFFMNFGQMDYLVDDRQTLDPKYRIIPLVVPAVEVFFGIFALIYGTVAIHVRIAFLIMSILGGLAGYLNLKHIIIPDVDFGIVRSVRGFNILSLLLEAFTLAEVGLNCFLINSPIIYIQGVLGIIYILILPVLDAEVKKWTQ